MLGTGITYRYRVDRTWKSFRSYLSEKNANRVVALCNRIAASGQLTYFDMIPREVHLEWLRIETMSLPILSIDGEEVWLLGGTFFSDEHGPDQRE